MFGICRKKLFNGKRVNIPVRRQKYNFADNVSNYWFENNKFMTHVMNGLSLLFPRGERFFVDSVRYFIDEIDDPEIKKEIRGFIGQEAMHSVEHDELNKVVEGQGLPVEEIDRHLEMLLSVAYKLPKRHQLAITCGLEHWTAMMASMFLERADLREAMEEYIQNLWVWHSIEEVEHKGVAYDLYNHVGHTYLERNAYLVISTIGLVLFASYVTTRMMLADKNKQGLMSNLYGLNRLFGYKGAFSSLIPEYFTYFKYNFHPWDNDNMHIVDQFRYVHDE